MVEQGVQKRYFAYVSPARHIRARFPGHDVLPSHVFADEMLTPPSDSSREVTSLYPGFTSDAKL